MPETDGNPWRCRWRCLVGIVIAAWVVGGCTSSEVATVAGVEAANGWSVSEIVVGLDGPTQITSLPDGRLLVAELAGGERDGVGRIVAIDTAGGGRAGPVDAAAGEVLFDGLITPTGVAVIDDEIWVMERRTLSRGPLGGGRLTPVLGPLPFNGRSETSLTPTPEGTLLYGTTGSLDSGAPAEGSGVLWEHDPDEGSVSLAAGFKNAYAHVFDGEGRLWVTEVSDGTFDGEQAPDELVAVRAGVDHGWPSCIGDRRPVVEFGGTDDRCADGPRSQAVFEPGATPTSVAVAPWDPETLLVALWVQKRVVAVPRDADGAPHAAVEVLAGDLRPQHLHADGERLLVVDFDGDRVLAVSAG